MAICDSCIEKCSLSIGHSTAIILEWQKINLTLAIWPTHLKKSLTYGTDYKTKVHE